jgi:hypothetical protein
MSLPNISEFSAALKGGMRGNRYKVILNLPSGIGEDTNTFSLMVRSTNVPSMETGVIETQYKGRVTKNSGDLRPSGDWTCNAFMNNGTKAATAKRIADKWQMLSFNEKDPLKYKSTAIIQLLNPADGSVMLSWKVEGIWMANSGELQLGDDQVDEILAFDMTFSYDLVTPQ